MLPVIADYRVPGPPANRVTWTPRPQRVALLVHDMQNHFVSAFEPGPLVKGLMANILSLRGRCHELGIPVLYSAQPGGQTRAQRGLLQDFWGDGVGTDPQDAMIVDELAPLAGDTVLTKWRYSAFHRTPLLETLREQGRDQLIITGIYAHIGCLATACDAFMHDVQPFFVSDATADFTVEDHVSALSHAARRCATAVTTDGLLAMLTHC